jgi:hypothetical protein
MPSTFLTVGALAAAMSAACALHLQLASRPKRFAATGAVTSLAVAIVTLTTALVK